MDTVTSAKVVSPGITYTEADAIRAGKVLASRGFVPADGYGYCLQSLQHTDVLGVLSGDQALTERLDGFASWLMSSTPKRMFLGVIDFQNEGKNITSKRWFFRVYGTKNVPMAIRLAEDLVQGTDLVIDLGLVDESVRYERYF